MLNPDVQKAVDQAIKRDANVTVTEFRARLNQTAIEFVQRVDSRIAAQAITSIPKAPQAMQISETRLQSEPVSLTFDHEVSPTGFNGGSGNSGFPLPDVYVMVNGTRYLATFLLQAEPVPS